ncbi:MAG: DUF3795 domain-containing protein [Armatimonadota bacterium]
MSIAQVRRQLGALRRMRDFVARLAARNQSVQGPLRRAAAALRTARAGEAKATGMLSQAAAQWTDKWNPGPETGTALTTMLAPCGIDCAKCDILARGDCAGCRGDPRKQWSGACTIRACCTDANHLSLCSQCDQLVCQKLKDWAATYPRHAGALERLRRMRRGA